MQIRLAFIVLLAAVLLQPMPARAVGVDATIQTESNLAYQRMISLVLRQINCLSQSTRPDDLNRLFYQNANQFYQGVNGDNTNKQPTTTRSAQDGQQLMQLVLQSLMPSNGPGDRGMGRQNGPYGCGQQQGGGQSAEQEQNMLDRMVIADLTNDAWAAPPANTRLAFNKPYAAPGEIKACAVDLKPLATASMTVAQAETTTTSVGADGRILANPIVAATLIAAGAGGQTCEQQGNDDFRCEPTQYTPNPQDRTGQPTKRAPTNDFNCKDISDCTR